MARELQEIIAGIDSEANKYKDLGILQAEAFAIIEAAQKKKFREFTADIKHRDALTDWQRTHPEVFAKLTVLGELPIEELRQAHPAAIRDIQINASKLSFWSYCKQSVALAIQIMENIFDKHKKEVEEIVKTTEIGTRPWYVQQALKYQHGYPSPATRLSMINNLLRYETIDPSRQIIKKAGIVETGKASLVLKVLKENNAILSEDEKRGLGVYMESVKILGTSIEIRSLEAEQITIDADVFLDPQVFNSEGRRHIKGDRAVQVAIEKYLAEIPIDGFFKKIVLEDTIQAVPGVLDVNLRSVNVTEKRQYESPAGHFRLVNPSHIVYKFFN